MPEDTAEGRKRKREAEEGIPIKEGSREGFWDEKDLKKSKNGRLEN